MSTAIKHTAASSGDVLLLVVTNTGVLSCCTQHATPTLQPTIVLCDCLQEENDRLRSAAATGGVPRAAAASGTVLLTEEQQEVLLAAQEAVQGYEDEDPAWDPAQGGEDPQLQQPLKGQKSLRTVGRQLAAAAQDLAAELEAELSDEQ
jgi:hypothetical protein